MNVAVSTSNLAALYRFEEKSKLVCWNLRNEEWCKNLLRYVSLNCGEVKCVDHDSSVRKHGAKRLCPNWYLEPVIPLSKQPETPLKS